MTDTETSTDGIPVPSWIIPVIGAVGTFAAGALVTDDLAAYWRPGLAPVLGAVVGMFVARPVAKVRRAAARRSGEIAGAQFGAAAGYAQAIQDQPEAAKPAGKATKKRASTG